MAVRINISSLTREYLFWHSKIRDTSPNGVDPPVWDGMTRSKFQKTIRTIIAALFLATLPSNADVATPLNYGNAGSGDSRSPGSALAIRVEAMLQSMEETLYQAKTEIDEESGSFRCDCSGLIGYVLRHYFPEAYLSLKGKEAPWRTRPYSVTYYETFVSSQETGSGTGGWRRIRRMMDAKPGDVLAWRKNSIKRGVSTGHTCMIAGMPVLEEDGRVRVRIIDSTNSRALHANDSRAPGTSGVGAGEMWFTVNAAGEPTGFFVNQHRTEPASSKVAIGRLIGAPSGVRDLRKDGTESQIYSDAPEDAGFVGLGKEDAIAKAESSRQLWRVVREDEVYHPVSMSIRNDRLNFVILDGKVVRIRRG